MGTIPPNLDDGDGAGRGRWSSSMARVMIIAWELGPVKGWGG